MTAPELLFCETFKHDSKNELNLDLVRFPQPVIIYELRILPLTFELKFGANNENHLVSETKPAEFSVEMFVNNLTKNGSSVFEKLGCLDYNETKDVQMLASHKVPTDVVILKGLYSSISVSVYGTTNFQHSKPTPFPQQPLVQKRLTSSNEIVAQPFENPPSTDLDTRIKNQLVNSEAKETSENPVVVQVVKVNTVEMDKDNMDTYKRDVDNFLKEKTVKKTATAHSKKVHKDRQQSRSSSGTPPKRYARDKKHSTKRHKSISPIKSKLSKEKYHRSKSRDKKRRARSRSPPKDRRIDHIVRTEPSSRDLVVDNVIRDSVTDLVSRELRTHNIARDARIDHIPREVRTDNVARDPIDFKGENSMWLAPPPYHQPPPNFSEPPPQTPDWPDYSKPEFDRPPPSDYVAPFKQLPLDQNKIRTISRVSCDKDRDSRERDKYMDSERSGDKKSRESDNARTESEKSQEDAPEQNVNEKPNRVIEDQFTQEKEWTDGRFKDASESKEIGARDQDRRSVSITAEDYEDISDGEMQVIDEVTEDEDETTGSGDQSKGEEDTDCDASTEVEDLFIDPANYFNPFANLVMFAPTVLCPVDVGGYEEIKWKLAQDDDNIPGAETAAAELLDILHLHSDLKISDGWVKSLDAICSNFNNALAKLDLENKALQYVAILCQWSDIALDPESTVHVGIQYKLKLIRYGLRLRSLLSGVSEKILPTDYCPIDGVVQLLTRDHICTLTKLACLKALDCITNTRNGLIEFLEQCFDDLTGYQAIVKLSLDNNSTVRVVEACNSLINKCNLFESMMEVKEIAAEVISADIPADNIKSILEEILDIIKISMTILNQPSTLSFPTTLKLYEGSSTSRSSKTVFRLMSFSNFLDTLLLLVPYSQSADFQQLAVILSEFIDTLLNMEDGVIYLLHQWDTTSQLVHCIASLADEDNPLTHSGVKLSYSLQIMSLCDTISIPLRAAILDESVILAVDMPDVVNPLQMLYSMTFDAIGKECLAKVMALHCSNLLDIVEKSIESGKKRPPIAFYYSTSLLLTVIENSHSIESCLPILKKLDIICSKETKGKLHDISKWIVSLRDIDFHKPLESIDNLVEYIRMNVVDLHAHCTVIAPGIIAALRCIEDFLRGDYENVARSQTVILKLYSSNIFDILIGTLLKLTTAWLKSWESGLRLSPYVMFLCNELVSPCLNIISRMLLELKGVKSETGENIKFKDTRVVQVCLNLYCLYCITSPCQFLTPDPLALRTMLMQLVLQFTKDIAVKTEADLVNSLWLVVLKHIIDDATVSPARFVPNLAFLANLLPVPLPLQSREMVSDEEICELLRLRQQWGLHVLGSINEFTTMFKSLIFSASLQVQTILQHICMQVSDLSAPCALFISRLLLDAVIENIESNLPHLSCCLQFIYKVALHPAIKAALIQLFCRRSDAELKYFDAFNQILCLLTTKPSEDNNGECQQFVMSFLLALLDTRVTLQSTEGELTIQRIANSFLDAQQLDSLVNAVVNNLSNHDYPFRNYATGCRILCQLSTTDIGYKITKNVLLENDLLFKITKRLTSKKMDNESMININKRPITADEKLILHNIPECLTLLQVLLGFSLPNYDISFRSGPALKSDVDTLFHKEGIPYTLKNLELSNASRLKEFPKLKDSVTESILSIQKEINRISPLVQTSEAKTVEPVSTFPKSEIPPAESLGNQFAQRCIVQLVSEGEEVDPYWEPLLPVCEVEGSRLEKSDLNEIAKDIVDFLFGEELLESQVIDKYCALKKRKKKPLGGEGKNKLAEAMIRTGGAPKKPMITRPNLFARGMTRGTLGRGTIVGSTRSNDFFRQRKMNTSRAPSMHVDDFLMLELTSEESGGANQPNDDSPRERVRDFRSNDRGRGFHFDRGNRGGYHRGGRDKFNSPRVNRPFDRPSPNVDRNYPHDYSPKYAGAFSTPSYYSSGSLFLQSNAFSPYVPRRRGPGRTISSGRGSFSHRDSGRDWNSRHQRSFIR